jgi:flavorubredoxin
MARPVVRPRIIAMETTVHEIADGTYRLSTFLPDISPAGFTMNQFLIDAEEPLLFHCGPRALFPLVSEAVSRVLPVERLRWITFGHVEADECGSMNQWLAAAPSAEVAHGALGCAISIADMADRPPRPLAEGEVLDIGGHRLRQISTPHVPHAWEAQVLFDESTGTLLCGDLFTRIGNDAALVHDADMVTPALAAEDMFNATSVTPSTAPTMRALAELAPRSLALMHGPSFTGDCAGALRDLADAYAERLTLATATAAGV